MRLFKILGIVLVNILILAVLLEGSMRLLGPNLPGTPGVAARWVLTGQPFDQTWTPAWQENRDHYYALRPGIEDALQYGSPSVSFRLSTIELWEGGGIGFRTNLVDFFVDTVVVGDSFGFCFTERADCWVDQLAQQAGLGIVNLSQPVTGTRSHQRILADFGAPLQPPLVLWQFFGNDFYDDYGLALFREEIEAAPESAVAPATQDNSPLGWLRRNSVAFAVLESATTGQFVGVPEADLLFVKPYGVRYGPDEQYLLQFGGAYEQQALDMEREINQIGLAYSRDAFREAQALVSGWDGELAVILIPTREEVYRHLTSPIMGEEAVQRLQSAREAMLALCEELGLRCFDAYEAFEPRALAGEALYYSDDMHLNPQGNAVLAEALQAWLDAEGLVNRSDP